MDYSQYLKLKEEINHHMDAYYNNDAPEISDFEYDTLMQQLKTAEAENPDWITPDSPSQKIGGVAKRTAGVKITHNVPMLSIEDVFTKDAVGAWYDKVVEMHPGSGFSVETKIDGLSLTLRYKKGEDGILHLYLAETRGDGLIGEDVTANAFVIPDIKQTLPAAYDSLELRGEVYMSHEDFNRYNAEQTRFGKKEAANPRNLAAGTLRQLDTSITQQRGLKMFVFNIQDGPSELMTGHTEALDRLNQLGVPVVYHRRCFTKEDIFRTIDDIAEMRSELPYDIDGVVIKVDNIANRNDFPAGSKYSAGHIAYKYPPEERSVNIDEIEVNVGRTGKLTFTAIFHDTETGKPARLCGTNVSRVTLHNQDYIDSMKIGIGGTYKVYKSGEIIPKLNGCVSEPSAVFQSPDYCPVCGQPLVREPDTADIRCFNPMCAVQLSRTIAYFASIDCMNIMGLGETLVDAMVSDGYIRNFSDIYKLKSERDELVESGIIGKEKNVDKILKAIDDSKNNSPVQLLAGFGIRNVGKRTAKALINHFHDIRVLINATQDNLTAVNDIGETTACSILEFFNNTENRNIIQELDAIGVNMAEEIPDSSLNALAGLTIVVTGTLPTLGRKEVTELIEKNGGKCTGSVSKKTDLLVAGEAAGSKLSKAQELGIRIISEEDLLNMIAGGGK